MQEENKEVLNNNYLVEKSKALIWSKFSQYSLGEMKLVDTYLSKINARDENSSEVTFSINEYLTLLGYKEPDKVTSKRIKKLLKKFLSAQIEIDLNGDGNYRLINLFSDATVMESNPDFEKRTITIDCNYKLKAAFFHLAERGYIEYPVDYSYRLRSKYSIHLYNILKDKSWNSDEWKVELTELRELLGATNKTNESFREFNKVLAKCQAEINSVTDITMTYEKITKGRLTRGIYFTFKKKGKQKKKKDENNIPESYNVPEITTETPYEKYVKTIDPNEESNIIINDVNRYADICKYKYTYNQTKELMLLLESKVREDIDFVGGVEMLREVAGNLLVKKLAALKNKEIKKSEFGLLKDMIIKDYY